MPERAGISIATITKLGKDGTVVSSDILVKICVALGCTMNDVMDIICMEDDKGYRMNHQSYVLKWFLQHKNPNRIKKEARKCKAFPGFFFVVGVTGLES